MLKEKKYPGNKHIDHEKSQMKLMETGSVAMHSQARKYLAEV